MNYTFIRLVSLGYDARRYTDKYLARIYREFDTCDKIQKIFSRESV